MLGPDLQNETRKGEHIRLSQPELAQAAIMLTWASDSDTMDMLAAPDSEPLRDKANLETEIERIKGFEVNDTNITWTILYQNRLVGQVWIDIDETSTDRRTGHISTIVGDKTVRNNGIGLAAKSAVLDWAFTDGNFTAINAWCLTQNKISEQSLKSLGFVYSHTDRNDELVAGEYSMRNHYVMSAERWKELL